ncbi:hypothetical protein MDA_GLEAN10001966 [Myotis davidii]|uniref:Uncharacterized protein n=1 Tax=Myotis davidii TaxID=225400 RepID=L5MLB9_MYODS|nr:hypothetical protein MDA_GLEAN10001966 [Myotis davidii]
MERNVDASVSRQLRGVSRCRDQPDRLSRAEAGRWELSKERKTGKRDREDYSSRGSEASLLATESYLYCLKVLLMALACEVLRSL